jgi:GH25 family lysozyme M1 (1,4-beta-N-acetylmuramidase)
MIEGIDVSKFQGTIDWDKVAAAGTVAFVFCKATERTDSVDPSFQTNWNAVKAHGFVRGAYHFAHPSNDPVAEADHFANTVGTLDPTDMLVLDIETANISGPQFVNWVITWLERVEQRTGTTPMVYTGGPFFDSHDGTPDQATMQRLARFPLWLAAYTLSPDKFVPPEWKTLGWKFWQRSGDVAAPGDTVLHVPGINGAVDRDEFRGTLDELKAFALNCHPGTNNVFTTAVNTTVDSTKPNDVA